MEFHSLEKSIDFERPIASTDDESTPKSTEDANGIRKARSPIFDVPFIPVDLMKSPVNKIQKVKAYSAGSWRKIGHYSSRNFYKTVQYPFPVKFCSFLERLALFFVTPFISDKMLIKISMNDCIPGFSHEIPVSCYSAYLPCSQFYSREGLQPFSFHSITRQCLAGIKDTCVYIPPRLTCRQVSNCLKKNSKRLIGHGNVINAREIRSGGSLLPATRDANNGEWLSYRRGLMKSSKLPRFSCIGQITLRPRSPSRIFLRNRITRKHRINETPSQMYGDLPAPSLLLNSISYDSIFRDKGLTDELLLFYSFHILYRVLYYFIIF